MFILVAWFLTFFSNCLFVICEDSTSQPSTSAALTSSSTPSDNTDAPIPHTTLNPRTTAKYETTYPRIALRAFYVIAVLSALVILYFIARAICSRRRKARMKRYGKLRDDVGDRMEMRPLSEADEDDDDDDMTLFDLSKQRNRSKR